MLEQPILVDAAAELLGCSVRTIHERARLALIPHRKAPYTRRLLFYRGELLEWLDGCELEHRELPGGGRVVRPK
jgi:hypothetical protein